MFEKYRLRKYRKKKHAFELICQSQQVITYQSNNRKWKLNNKMKMSHLKTDTMPVGALKRIKKETDQHIDKIAERPSLCEIEKIALYRTIHLLRRVLSTRQKNISQKRQQKHEYIECILSLLG